MSPPDAYVKLPALSSVYSDVPDECQAVSSVYSLNPSYLLSRNSAVSCGCQVLVQPYNYMHTTLITRSTQGCVSEIIG